MIFNAKPRSWHASATRRMLPFLILPLLATGCETKSPDPVSAPSICPPALEPGADVATELDRVCPIDPATMASSCPAIDGFMAATQRLADQLKECRA